MRFSYQIAVPYVVIIWQYRHDILRYTSTRPIFVRGSDYYEETTLVVSLAGLTKNGSYDASSGEEVRDRCRDYGR